MAGRVGLLAWHPDDVCNHWPLSVALSTAWPGLAAPTRMESVQERHLRGFAA